MKKALFDSKLLQNGHLYCPEEFAKPDAKYKVIVSLPDEDVTDSDIEIASITDVSEEFLTKDEVEYYLQLEEL